MVNELIELLLIASVPMMFNAFVCMTFYRLLKDDIRYLAEKDREKIGFVDKEERLLHVPLEKVQTPPQAEPDKTQFAEMMNEWLNGASKS